MTHHKEVLSELKEFHKFVDSTIKHCGKLSESTKNSEVHEIATSIEILASGITAVYSSMELLINNPKEKLEGLNSAKTFVNTALDNFGKIDAKNNDTNIHNILTQLQIITSAITALIADLHTLSKNPKAILNSIQTAKEFIETANKNSKNLSGEGHVINGETHILSLWNCVLMIGICAQGVYINLEKISKEK